MKIKIVFIIAALALIISGCGIIHNSLHPYKEHCLYHCYNDALTNEKIKGITECEFREMALQLNTGTCDLKCMME